MSIEFRKATAADIDRIGEIYEAIHTESECGRTYTGWVRGVYPIKGTAAAALGRGDLFAEESDRSEERRVGKECRSRWSPYH